MHFIGKILEILNAEMETPTIFGWFHILFFALSIAAGFWLCSKFKYADEKTTRKILLITSVMAIGLEVYKQINYTFVYDGTQINTDFLWYAFPFQFCSTPMYVGLAAALIKHKKIYDALCAYLATFSLFAGLCVMCYPAQVFIPTIGINIQTMICHGVMITIGIYLLGTGYVKSEHKTILKAIPVFTIFVVIASIMNEIAYLSGLLETDNFNMFYISPHCDPSLPVYSLVQAVVPYPWCLFIYVLCFSAASYIILLVTMLVKHIVKKNTK